MTAATATTVRTNTYHKHTKISLNTANFARNSGHLSPRNFQRLLGKNKMAVHWNLIQIWSNLIHSLARAPGKTYLLLLALALSILLMPCAVFLYLGMFLLFVWKYTGSGGTTYFPKCLVENSLVINCSRYVKVSDGNIVYYIQRERKNFPLNYQKSRKKMLSRWTKTMTMGSYTRSKSEAYTTPIFV